MTDRMQKALKKASPAPVNVNHASKLTGDTALIKGVINGSSQIVSALISAKADVNAVNNDGWTALMHAIDSEKHENETVESMLREAGAVISAKQKKMVMYNKKVDTSDNGDSGASGASGEIKPDAKEAEATQLMVKLGGLNNNNNNNDDDDEQEGGFQSKIFADVPEQDLQHIKQNVPKMTEMFIAVALGNTKIVTTLLAANADVEERSNDNDKSTLLGVASYGGFMDVVMILLAANANINDGGKHGEHGPLILACNAGHADIAHQLILAGANLNATNPFGQTASELANSRGFPALEHQIEQIALPPIVLSVDEVLPLSVQLLVAGMPLQPYPQPAYQTILYHEGLLLTEIGPWLRDVGLPNAARDPFKFFVLALIRFSYTALATIDRQVATKFLNDFLIPAVQSQEIDVVD